MPEFSPTGKLVVPSFGPLDAKIVLIGESPAAVELSEGRPLVGPSGKMLNKALAHAGIDRTKCYVMNLVPVRAPGDKFVAHSAEDIEWGRERFKRELALLTNAKVYVALGANPTEWLLGGKPPVAQYGESKREGFISAWRGSVLPIGLTRGASAAPEDYLGLTGLRLEPVAHNPAGVVIPTFHPSAVLRQFEWHPWLLLDLQRVAKVAKGDVEPRKYRQWYRNDPEALKRLAEADIGLVAIDTELDPWIVSLVTDEEVHVFEWDERYRRALTKIVTNDRVLKVAHRWLHDYAFFHKCLEIDVTPPIFDSIGGAHCLNTALRKELSPHISTRFTNWPYHKWLSSHDPLHYCGMDSIVCYDSYWPMIQEATRRGLAHGAQILTPGQEPRRGILEHDHRVFTPLLVMQAKGFKIDEGERSRVAEELKQELDTETVKLQALVEPIIEKEFKRFVKPHLFRVLRKCNCCGGGTGQRVHCQFCSTAKNTETGPRNACPLKAEGLAAGFKTLKAYKESWVPCRTCDGTGKVIKKLDFNADSPDQLADVVYRGLKIRPRKYKGVETVKAAQLNALASRSPVISSIVGVSAIRADFDTVNRLHAGVDGCLHCEFDPWGTGSGRVASKEGLIDAGTNAQNLPKLARRFVVPRTGYKFIYPDMAQIEARGYAVISGDKVLRKALYEVIPELGKPDYHTYLAQAIHAYDSRISISRDQSKRTSYAGFFGVSPKQLAMELTAEAFRKKEGMTVDEKTATVILETLYRVCPDIKRIQQEMCDEVMRTRRLRSPYTGREFTWLGYIADKKNKGELDREIRKQVYSRFVQDMANYVLSLGLIDLYYTSNEWGKLVTPLIHAHDALLIEVPETRIEEASALALTSLSRYIWGMDFPAEMSERSKQGKGDNWYVVS